MYKAKIVAAINIFVFLMFLGRVWPASELKNISIFIYFILTLLLGLGAGISYSILNYDGEANSFEEYWSEYKSKLKKNLMGVSVGSWFASGFKIFFIIIAAILFFAIAPEIWYSYIKNPSDFAENVRKEVCAPTRGNKYTKIECDRLVRDHITQLCNRGEDYSECLRRLSAGRMLNR